MQKQNLKFENFFHFEFFQFLYIIENFSKIFKNSKNRKLVKKVCV